MDESKLPCAWHRRIRLEDYNDFYRHIPERELNHHDVTSPFDAWSIVKLRSKLKDQTIEKIPTEIVIWGRGEPSVCGGTKIGGLPVWPQDQPLPSARNGRGNVASELRFFGQFNFLDSLDLLPELPAGLLSVWVTSEFPWEPKSIKCFWIDPKTSVQVNGPISEVTAGGIPETPFFASLLRTWDPVPNQDIEPVKVDHQFEAYRNYLPRRWDATKIGGLEAMPQWGLNPRHGQFIFQFGSIQAASEVPYPWVNRVEPFDLNSGENGIYNKENCLVLGDMGAISFCLKRDGQVKPLFECH